MEALPLALSLDFLTQAGFWLGVLVLAGIYALVALGLQLNVGFTGIVNFGAAGFMAVGAYSMAIITLDTGISFWLSLPLSILITIAFGLLIGLPALRLRADYLAIVTIAAAEVIRLIAQNARELTNGNEGLTCSEEDFSKCYDSEWLDVSDTIEGWVADIGIAGNPDSFFAETLFPLFLVVWVTVVLVTLGLSLIQRTPWGRVLRAVREDEDAARALGKNAFAYKLQSLSISAAIGAIAGWFLALDLATIHPFDYEPLVTFYAFAVLVLGGLANYWGVMIGAVLFWALIEGTRFIEIGLDEVDLAAVRFGIAGLILILVMAFRPQGIFGKKEEMVLGE